MKNNDSDRLLNQVLADQGWESFRHTSLELGLAAMRRRRRCRRAAQIGVLAGLLLLGTLVAVFTSERSPSRMTRLPASSRGLASGDKHGVKMITDEELFALFPDRPMALVGKPGHQQLVFLDEASPVQVPLSQ